jgi:predicted MFS family arabinose efflux permease
MILVLVYTNLSVTPLWVVILLNTVLFVAITSRMISSSALMTAVPEPADRGAFMGVNSSVAQISGGFASALAGIIVVQTPGGMLQHYPTLGYVVVASMIVTIVMMYYINRMVQREHKPVFVAEPEGMEN